MLTDGALLITSHVLKCLGGCASQCNDEKQAAGLHICIIV